MATTSTYPTSTHNSPDRSPGRLVWASWANVHEWLGLKKRCNDFIHKEEEAKLFQKERQGITYLFFIDVIMVGYATLAMSSIPAERMERRFRKTISLSFFPSLLIGRLGVSNDWRRKGIGEYICNWCVGLTIDLSDKIGCRYVILETSKGERETFYSKCNFQKAKELVDDRKERVWMYQRIDML